ncbi:excalibur calcium-binding domain-containing protein [Pseudonocardia sp. EV170527-09]|uniref:excalibur calcium-binding domain-containing protein n=1 Tax=Pseudonocardia sp. EV170527-09 TaxID=2603411 RepID=UPI0011F2F5BA|nr:excalibur calcium-binding domain-containing protein [Pseudonocardia sp. EV170527-09]KAA1019427.1 excalibur calcium-binding domain-containing protein [Pseudonocardia sp. EV170527-09]
MTARSLVRRTGAVAATVTLAALAGLPLAGAASAAEPAATPVTSVVTAPAQEDTEEPPVEDPADDATPADAPDATDPDATDPEETTPEETTTAPETTTPAAGAPTAGRGSDLDCVDLSRAQAQAVLAADPSDPHNLDRDGDGRACEGPDLVAAAGTGQVRAVPGGGVEAGDGSGGAGVDPTVFLLVGTGAVLAAGAGVVVWSGRRTGRASLPLTTRHS